MCVPQDWRYEKLRATFKQYPKARPTPRRRALVCDALCPIVAAYLPTRSSLQELTEPKTVEEDETKQSWTAALPSQAPEHHKCAAAGDPSVHSWADCGTPAFQTLRSPERKPEDFVYLLVRKAGGAWQFPQAAHETGETVRKVRLTRSGASAA